MLCPMMFEILTPVKGKAGLVGVGGLTVSGCIWGLCLQKGSFEHVYRYLARPLAAEQFPQAVANGSWAAGGREDRSFERGAM